MIIREMIAVMRTSDKSTRKKMCLLLFAHETRLTFLAFCWRSVDFMSHDSHNVCPLVCLPLNVCPSLCRSLCVCCVWVCVCLWVGVPFKTLMLKDSPTLSLLFPIVLLYISSPFSLPLPPYHLNLISSLLSFSLSLLFSPPFSLLSSQPQQYLHVRCVVAMVSIMPAAYPSLKDKVRPWWLETDSQIDLLHDMER